ARCEEAITAGHPELSGMGRKAVAVYRAARAARGEPVDPAELWFAIETDRTTWSSPVLGGMLGSCHALDLPFVFGTLEHRLMRPLVGRGPAASALAARMQDAWAAFARTGRPSHPGLEEWPAYERTRRRTMILDAQCRVENAPREPERAFWESLDRGAGRASA